MFNKTKFLLRYDDICETLNWELFEKHEEIIGECEIKPIFGVVPDNQDLKLRQSNPRPDFWKLVRRWNGNGWTIAQHGTFHICHPTRSGYLNHSIKSEFTGLPLKKQIDLIGHGKKILVDQNVWQPYFMPPSHSFDKHTLEALRFHGFKAITDGDGICPYGVGGIVCVPQLFSSGKNFGFGVYTICLHSNTMLPENLKELSRFLRKNRSRFISFQDALNFKKLKVLGPISRLFTSLTVRRLQRWRITK
jgi:hypothetical protein